MAEGINIFKANGSNGSSLLDALNTMENNSSTSNVVEETPKHTFLDHIKMRAVEEYNDVVTYMELANMTEEDEFKKMLKDIAKEEMTHGKCLEHIIMHSREMPADIENARSEADEAMK